MAIFVYWSDLNLEILKTKTEEVSFSLHGERLQTHTKSILAEIQEAHVEISSSESDHEQ